MSLQDLEFRFEKKPRAAYNQKRRVATDIATKSEMRNFRLEIRKSIDKIKNPKTKIHRGGDTESNNHDRRGRKMGVRITVLILGISIGIILFAYISFTVPHSIAYDGTSIRQVIIVSIVPAILNARRSSYSPLIRTTTWQVFRHGDRNPTETYPNDPYRDYNWQEGWGALTKVEQNHKIC